MEDSLPLKASWGVEAKAMQQCLTDIFTSVYTTCDIPENAIFGPCVLSHTSLYDSIAFIALKSTDKRTAPYIFRVDTSVGSGSSEGLVWLRLVQSARDREEQNLEAYIKSGQLFYRSLRRIEKDEELLVWYGKDLVTLLLLSSGWAHRKSKGAPPYLCQDCNQCFQFEFPFLAHLRFCCTKGQYHLSGVDGDCENNPDHVDPIPPRSSPKLLRTDRRSDSKDAKPATDFHNLARDLENNRIRPPGSREAEIKSGSKRKLSEEVEKTSRSSPKEDPRGLAQRCQESFSPEEKRQAFSPPYPEPTETKSTFAELRGASESLKQGLESPGIKDVCRPSTRRQALTETRPYANEGHVPSSAFSLVACTIGSPDRKSAFSQLAHPDRRPSPLGMTSKLLPLNCHPSMGEAARLYQADHLISRLRSQDLLPHDGPRQSPFLFSAPFWPKASGAVAMQAPPTLTLLPPSFTSLCLPAQNWCAKCNASFRMTSDLVYHMRSHHKKEFSMEPLVKRRREEKLKCPICSESFRERHHLSRHMTSHN